MLAQDDDWLWPLRPPYGDRTWYIGNRSTSQSQHLRSELWFQRRENGDSMAFQGGSSGWSGWFKHQKEDQGKNCPTAEQLLHLVSKRYFSGTMDSASCHIYPVVHILHKNLCLTPVPTVKNVTCVRPRPRRCSSAACRWPRLPTSQPGSKLDVTLFGWVRIFTVLLKQCHRPTTWEWFIPPI